MKLPRTTLGLFLAIALTLATPLHAQGCSQCRESIGQTPARTQTAYRRAIAVLTLAALGVCTATTLAIRRFR